MDETKSTMSYGCCYCYCAKIPFETENSEIQPKQRAADISAARCEKVRVQKFFAWKLLEHALKEQFGLKIGDADIVRGDNGKWICRIREDCFFSISHTEKAVAVAVFEKPCGVDIERFNEKRFLSERLAGRILSGREKKEYAVLSSDSDDLEDSENSRKAAEKKSRYTALKWTQKESIFKMRGGDIFIPSEIDTTGNTACCGGGGRDGAGFFLASKRFVTCSDEKEAESMGKESFFLTACGCGFDYNREEADGEKTKVKFLVYGNGKLLDV